MSGAASNNAVRLRFYLPPEDLRPFVTTIYQLDVSPDPAGPIEDVLHPEWANIRLVTRGDIDAAVGDAGLQRVPRAILVGPTSRATRFRAEAAQSWGIGLLPLGWARILDQPADEYADRFADLSQERALERLAPITACLAIEPADPQTFKDCLADAIRTLLLSPQSRDTDIVALERALVDKSAHTVSHLAEKTGMSLRTLERLSKSVFGFTPQLLLRRQRFLRSLAQFMLDPSLKWIETLDSHYHDQAHFVRDFKRFMGMSPSAYAKQSHPVLGAAAHARKEIAGEAMQVLHKPPAD